MKLPAKSVTAVIPTRGDIDLRPLVTLLRQIAEIDQIWMIASSTPFNRYLAGWKAPTNWVYTQDDDCLTRAQVLFDNAARGLIVNAMTEEHALEYPGRQTLIGFGAVFERILLEPLLGDWERDELFLRESDRVFGTLHAHRSYFPAIAILPEASNPNRYWKQAEHVPSRVAIEKRIFERTGLRPR